MPFFLPSPPFPVSPSSQVDKEHKSSKGEGMQIKRAFPGVDLLMTLLVRRVRQGR